MYNWFTRTIRMSQYFPSPDHFDWKVFSYQFFRYCLNTFVVSNCGEEYNPHKVSKIILLVHFKYWLLNVIVKYHTSCYSIRIELQFNACVKIKKQVAAQRLCLHRRSASRVVISWFRIDQSFATHIKTRTTRIIAPDMRCINMKMPTVRLLLLCVCFIYVQQCDSQSVLQGRRFCMYILFHVRYVIELMVKCSHFFLQQLFIIHLVSILTHSFSRRY